MSDVRIFHLFPIFMDFECFIAVSKVEEYLSLAYGGLKLFLRQVEPFLEGTMFKAPVAVINSFRNTPSLYQSLHPFPSGVFAADPGRAGAAGRVCLTLTGPTGRSLCEVTQLRNRATASE